jgi:Tol biopolymer transport system component
LKAIVLGVGALLACSGLSSSASTGREPREPTFVVFSRQQSPGSRNHDIYIAAADGSPQRRLTSGRGDEQTPKFSPDGKRIVFRAAADPGSAPEIWIMNRSGGGKRNLTRTPRKTEWSPAWTRDGKHIVFSCASAKPNGVGNDLCRMKPDGSGRRYLLKNPNRSDEYPTFAPSGRSFAYISYDALGDFEIWAARADGSHRHNLTRSPRMTDEWPAWSPTGSGIAWMRGAYGDIWLMNPDGSGKRNLTRTPTLSEQFPAWLPDGRLSFDRGDGRHEAGYGLWILSPGASAPVLLIKNVSGWPDWTSAKDRGS